MLTQCSMPQTADDAQISARIIGAALDGSNHNYSPLLGGCYDYDNTINLL